MNQGEAESFGRQWRADWNSRDVERIVAHYADDVVFTSPFVVAITGDASGTLRGKAALRDYFTRALERNPDLHFTEPLAYATTDGPPQTARCHYRDSS
jgi:ketosteroid isomerase-like protein